MLPILISGFTLGLLGSLHCVGMCGPLALSLPITNHSKLNRLKAASFYNLGRIVTYSFLGLIIGLFGNSMNFMGIQRWVSIAAGLLLVFILIHQYFNSHQNKPLFTGFYEWVRSMLGKYYFKENGFAFWMIGLLNGLLPCGFVYLAFAGAIAAGSLIHSISFMTAFGLGTFPLMFAISFMGLHINRNFGVHIKKAYPYMMFVVAVLLILRGMNLNIPYLSPHATIQKGAVHSCCHK